MRTDFLRLATLASIASAVCLVAPMTAQTAGRPRTPVAPAAPAAPRPARVPSRAVAPRALAPLSTWDGSTWDRLDDAGDDAMIASLDAANSLNDVYMDLDAIAPLPSLNLDIAPMIASAMPMANFNLDFAPRASFSLPESPRAPWASADPADSLYRLARQSLNAGDYRKAAQLFAQISRQYPTSQYKSDAIYWRAFALYRIGDTADLHEALSALDSAGLTKNSALRTAKSANAVEKAYSGEVATTLAAAKDAMASSDMARASANVKLASDQFHRNYMAVTRDNDSAILAMRIRSALAARGDAAAAAQIASAAAAGAPSCDEEDADLRVEALNALIQMDPRNAEPAITKVLARRDSCSVPLRRGAVSLAARIGDPSTTALLISTARNDPSLEVQAEAVRGLSRSSDAATVSTLAEIATSSKNPALQRIAVRSLAAQDSPAARQAIKSLMSRADLPGDVRITALHYAGKSDLTVANLSSMYDAASDRSTRQEIVSLLQQRPESEASDKLVSIARTSTDPSLRRRAIDALAARKDPRAKQLLMDILNK